MEKQILQKQKNIGIYAILLFSLFLSGCWDRTEVNDLAIVIATGLDITDEGEIELSAQFVNPKEYSVGQGGVGGGKLTTVEKATGKTIADASSKLQQKVSRTLFPGHSRVLFISKKIAEAGINKQIDFFARGPYPRLRSFVFVTEQSPVDLLKVSPDLESSSGEVARELSRFWIAPSITIKDLLESFHGKEQGTVIPMIEIEEEDSDIFGLHINGTAILKEGKMVGELDNEITRGILWMRGEIETADVTIEPEDEKGMITFHIFSADTNLIPKIENGTWKVIAKITSKDDPSQNSSNLNLMNPEVIKKLEKQLEEKIDQRIDSALEYVQKDLKTDIFGFNELFHRHYPEQWAKVQREWEEIFSELEVELQINVDIQRPGRSASPQGIPEDEVIGE